MPASAGHRGALVSRWRAAQTKAMKIGGSLRLDLAHTELAPYHSGQDLDKVTQTDLQASG